MDKICILAQPHKDMISSECLESVRPWLRCLFSCSRIKYYDFAQLLEFGIDVERIQYHYPGVDISSLAQLRGRNDLPIFDWLPQTQEGAERPTFLLFESVGYLQYSFVESEPVAEPFTEEEIQKAADALLERQVKDKLYNFAQYDCYEFIPSKDKLSDDSVLPECSLSPTPQPSSFSGETARSNWKKEASCPSVFESTEKEDADEDFWVLANQLEEEIVERVMRLREMGVTEQVLASLLQLPTPELSHMTITPDYRIRLTDYDKEIKMSVLPKVLYFLFINHPEGLLFKNLVDHTDELMHYYNLLSNRENPDQMRKSIEDLVDSTSNSVNEKCSRIRSAFIQHFSEDVVNPYFVTSSLNRIKSVTFDRHLITSYPKELGWSLCV